MAGKNIGTEEHTGNLTLPYKQNREYFFILMTTGSCTVTLGGGGGSIPLEEGHYFEPLYAPTGTIEIVSTGTYVIAEG